MEDYLTRVRDLVQLGHKDTIIATELGVTRHQARKLMRSLTGEELHCKRPKPKRVTDEASGTAEVSGVIDASTPETSLAILLAEFEVDLSKWTVVKWIASKWGRFDLTPSYQVKAWLSRKSTDQSYLEDLCERLKARSPIRPLRFQPLDRRKHRRALEICVTDPHFGMTCYRPQADDFWSPDKCMRIFDYVVQDLLQQALIHDPFEEILWILGNDYLHADNVWHTTTGGTVQPEMGSWHEMVKLGRDHQIATILALSEYAPVRVVVVPGNHSRQTEYALGLMIESYFHNDENVTVDASASPYKFWKYGVNLVGFEHGHSVAQVRLAAVMANETRTNGWADARYCEWHLGDQHRKGSAKPSMMEEQGVSVEFLPGLTPPNEWHRIKSYNHQKRAGVAFIWDYDKGQRQRILSNIDSVSGEPMGVVNA